MTTEFINGGRQEVSNRNDKPERILSKKSLRKLDVLHSYMTYFLFGAFLGLSLGGMYEQFIGFPSYIANNIDVHVMSITVGSSLAILAKIIFSLK